MLWIRLGGKRSETQKGATLCHFPKLLAIAFSNESEGNIDLRQNYTHPLLFLKFFFSIWEVTQGMGKNVFSTKKANKKKECHLEKGKEWILDSIYQTEWKLIFVTRLKSADDAEWSPDWSEASKICPDSHFWLAFSPLPCVLALSFVSLVSVAHEVFTQLLNHIGSLLGRCWLLVDGHNNCCKEKNQS